MMNKKMLKAFNESVVAETYNAYLYLSMAAYFESLGLKGFTNWMKCQAQEELTHAMLFFKHIVERGGRVELGPIGAPPTEWKSPQAAFEAAYTHEQKTTARINGLVDLAEAEKDRMAMPVLQWFVNEQIEEEASTSEVASNLKLAGDGSGLFLLDRQAATRTFVYPPAVLTGGSAGAGPAAGA